MRAVSLPGIKEPSVLLACRLDERLQIRILEFRQAVAGPRDRADAYIWDGQRPDLGDIGDHGRLGSGGDGMICRGNNVSGSLFGRGNHKCCKNHGRYLNVRHFWRDVLEFRSENLLGVR